jgi:hypothetical protein
MTRDVGWMSIAASSLFVAVGCASSGADDVPGAASEASQTNAAAVPYHRDCVLSKLLDDTVFQESLSPDDDDASSVSVERTGAGEVRVSIGTELFSSRRRREMSVSITRHTTSDLDARVSLLRKDTNGGAIQYAPIVTYRVRVRGRSGEILAGEPGRRSTRVATLRCSMPHLLADEGEPCKSFGNPTLPACRSGLVCAAGPTPDTAHCAR